MKQFVSFGNLLLADAVHFGWLCARSWARAKYIYVFRFGPFSSHQFHQRLTPHLTEAINKVYFAGAILGWGNELRCQGVKTEPGCSSRIRDTLMRNKNMDFVDRWRREASEEGNATAQHRLGVRYASGLGVDKDESEAVKWFRLAAEGGHAGAQERLGHCYANGLGLARDERTAANWYRQAAEQGQPDAQIALGNLYASGAGVEQDDAAAVSWYRKAAEQGQVDAQDCLGAMFLAGRGVERDDQAAYAWFQKAAGAGHAGAQCHLGQMYADGHGVARDERAACDLFRKAAEAGYGPAQYHLGTFYEHGRGVIQDFVQAYCWYSLAAITEAEARAARDALGESMTADQVGAAQKLAMEVHARLEEEQQVRARS